MPTEKAVHRRAVLQTLALGLGAASLGRALFACDTKDNTPPRNTTLPPERNPDDDEYVPGKSTPVNAGDTPPALPNTVWESRVKQLEAEQTRLFNPMIFTKNAPGTNPDAHIPKAAIVEENGAKKVEVVVNHVMDKNLLDGGVYAPGDGGGMRDADATADANGKMDASDDADAADANAKAPDATPTTPAPPQIPHYITTIYLRGVVDGKDTVVALWEFASTDKAPPTVHFPISPGVTSVTAYEWCTRHGLWAAEPLTIA